MSPRRAIPEKKPQNKLSPWIIVGGTVALIVVVLLAVEVLPKLLASATTSTSTTAAGKTKGDANAPVTIVELAHFLCPYCGSFALDAGRRINDNFVKTGKVKFTYQHFAFYPDAELPAEASECASEQGKFWEYHDKAYGSQGRETFTKDTLKRYAAELGLDQSKFNACLDSGKYRALVRAETEQSAKTGSDSVPTFFINGRKIVGARPYEEFERAINEALGKK